MDSGQRSWRGADKSDRGTKIAVVNLDEGVDTDNGKVQYAAQLLPYAGAESALAEANRVLEDISFEEELEGFAEKGEEARAELEAVIRQYDDYLAEYNGTVEASNEIRSGVKTALSDYERVETAYQELLEQYKAGADRDHYAFIDKEAYIKKLGETLENVGIGAVPAPYLTWEEYIGAVTEEMPEDEYCRTAALIQDCAPGMDRGRTENNGGFSGFSSTVPRGSWKRGRYAGGGRRRGIDGITGSSW